MQLIYKVHFIGGIPSDQADQLVMMSFFETLLENGFRVKLIFMERIAYSCVTFGMQDELDRLVAKYGKKFRVKVKDINLRKKWEKNG